VTPAERLARAVLIFHAGGTWGENERALWREFTRHDGATTKVLCDLAREILKGEHDGIENPAGQHEPTRGDHRRCKRTLFKG
jgi:hypothetical protein